MPATNHRTTFQSAESSGPLHPDLAAFRRRFFEELSVVVMGSRIDVLHQLRPILENVGDSNDQDQIEIGEKVREAHVAFEKGLWNCLDSMGSLVREWFSKLVKLAQHHPEWTIEDSQWIRGCMQELLNIQISEQPDSRKPRRHVADRWLRYVYCYLYESETDLPESWRAPAWFDHSFVVSQWIRKGCPQHLTAERTQQVVKRWRQTFDGRLKNELDRAEDYARIEIGLRDKLTPPSRASQPGSKPTAPITSLHRKLKSPLRRACWACLMQDPDASDKQMLDWLRQNNSKVIPPNWEDDDSLAGKTFTKVRKAFTACQQPKPAAHISH